MGAGKDAPSFGTMGNALGKYVTAGGSRDVCARKQDSAGLFRH
jgi:hypothetical protein